MRYRKCPVCGDMMTRKNFRESSGIVIDICSAHGIWFDQGELAMVFEFAATGALAKAERDAAGRTEASVGEHVKPLKYEQPGRMPSQAAS